MIRVLQLLTATTLGGGPRQVYHLVRRLPRDEFTVCVGGPENRRYHEQLGALGVALAPLDVDRRGRFWRTVFRTLRLIRESRAEVVHTHGKGAGFYGRVAALVAGVPVVHTFHGIHYESYPRAGRCLYLALERCLAHLTHTVINVSASQDTEALALGVSRPGRSAVVVNGIDAEELDTLSPWGRSSLLTFEREDVTVLGCVARFDPVKRHEVLLRALSRIAPRHPRVRLLLVGGGPEEHRIKRLAVALPIPPGSIVFPGALGWRTNPYAAMDIYVTASAKEGLPLAPLEAMASRLPVIASDVPGHREVVAHGETGLLVAPEDDKALAEAIESLLDDSERRARMGRAGRERVLRDFAIGPMVEKTAAIYRAAVVTPGRRR